MKYTIDLTTQQVAGPYDKTPDGATTIPLADFIDKTKDKFPFSTGLMPVNGSGLLSLQHGYGYEQIIYQLKPGIETVRWGESEGTKNKTIYNVAVPYRIYIADFKNGAFTGCRHFFSPHPIFHWDQPLYVPNLPNTNCKGYRGTSVGWVCLYLHDNTTGFTLQQRIEYFLGRMSGVAEPYNDNNMSSTDGPRFYASQKKPEFLVSPTAWHTKTKEEGFEWILDSELLIPFKVRQKEGLHSESYDANGEPYTLHRAANEPYSAYYSDADYIKPWMKSTNELPSQMLSSILMGQGNTSVKIAKEPKKLSSPEEFLGFFAQIPAPEVKDVEEATNILSGNKKPKCPSCSLELSNSSSVFSSVIYNQESGKITPVSKPVQWCKACVQNKSTYFSNIGFVDNNSLLFSVYMGKYILPQLSTICPDCSSVFLNADKQKYGIYTVGEEAHLLLTYCTLCRESSEYAEDFVHKLKVMKYCMHETKTKQLSLESSTIGFTEISIWSTSKIDYCKCKLFALTPTTGDTVNAMGGLQDMCGSCISTSPDLNEPIKYTPKFSFDPVPTEAII